MRHMVFDNSLDSSGAEAGGSTWNQLGPLILLLLGLCASGSAQAVSEGQIQLLDSGVFPTSSRVLRSSSGMVKLEQASLGRLRGGNHRDRGNLSMHRPQEALLGPGQEGIALLDPIALPVPIVLPMNSHLQGAPGYPCSRVKGIVSVPHSPSEACGSRLPREPGFNFTPGMPSLDSNLGG